MKTTILILALVLVLVLAATGAALANGNLDLSRWVFNGGASDSTAGNTTLRATLGQPVVGLVSSGDVTLGQGFWHGVSSGFEIYLPLVLR
jgi:hypothetical protein